MTFIIISYLDTYSLGTKAVYIKKNGYVLDMPPLHVMSIVFILEKLIY